MKVALIAVVASSCSGGDRDATETNDGALLNGNLLEGAPDELVADVCPAVGDAKQQFVNFDLDGFIASYQGIVDRTADDDSARHFGEIAGTVLKTAESWPAPGTLSSEPSDDTIPQAMLIQISQTNVAMARLQLACVFEGYAPS